MRKWLTDYRYLTLAQYYNQLGWLPFMVVISALLPVGMLFGLRLIGGGIGGAGVPFVITGSAVVSIVTMAVTSVATDLFFERRLGAFVYYASLPIARSAFILAIVTIRLVNTLPGVVVTLVAGKFLYDADLAFSPWLVVVILLSILSLIGLGAAIGLGVSNEQVLHMLANLSIIFVMFGAPVMIPADLLPGALQVAGYFLPPTYAANAFRGAVFGASVTTYWVDLLVLAGFGVLSFIIVTTALRWRAE
ncbi:MAG: ABC transporter permease [Actinobacteria bacterium]|nr:ABC transporter permease [Actinomycetota bacterium]